VIWLMELWYSRISSAAEELRIIRGDQDQGSPALLDSLPPGLNLPQPGEEEVPTPAELVHHLPSFAKGQSDLRTSRKSSSYALRVRWLQHAGLGDDRRDQLVRRDVEGEVERSVPSGAIRRPNTSVTSPGCRSSELCPERLRQNEPLNPTSNWFIHDILIKECQDVQHARFTYRG